MINSLSHFIALKADFFLFACVTLVLLLVAHAIAFRRTRMGHNALWQRVGFAVFITTSWMMVETAETHEHARLRGALEGVLPTYAAEFQRMGHARINASTPANDDSYLRMIEAEKRWLHVNQNIRDIYTMRRTRQGKAELIVDSETDFDQDGKYASPHEMRSFIGEPLTVDSQTLKAVFDGEQALVPNPIVNRWGSWISAFAPIRDEAGKIEAVVGADADAEVWMLAIHKVRLEAISYLSGVFILGTLTLIGLSIRSLARDHSLQKLAAREIEESKSRLESIINSIDGIVWEFDPGQHRFNFISQQAKAVMGFDAQQLMEDPHRWCQNVVPEDEASAKKVRDHATATKTPYVAEYRYVRQDGKTLWLRERGVVVPAHDDRPLCIRGVLKDITESKESAAELEALNRQMVETSRQAGMAEVASGVLHNVGNVLNSVNVSSTVIYDIVQESKAKSLGKVAQLLLSQEHRLTEFISNDPRGKAIPQFIAQLAKELGTEQEMILSEMRGLSKNVAHIKQIVMMQQSFARTGGSTEPQDVEELIADALRINQASLVRHGVTVVRDFTAVSLVQVDRNKVLQILINLIRNAKHAMEERDFAERRLRITIKPSQTGKVVIEMKDNGSGMTPETMAKLFSYGFTTKKDGHGFGLHSGMNAAREMGGSLTAQSDGPGHGSTFRLELPIASCALVHGTPLPAVDPLPVLPSIFEGPTPAPFTQLLSSATPPAQTAPPEAVLLP